jgi:hypothetical protein
MLYSVVNISAWKKCIMMDCPCCPTHKIIRRSKDNTEAVVSMYCGCKCGISILPLLTKQHMDIELATNPKWYNKNIL